MTDRSTCASCARARKDTPSCVRDRRVGTKDTFLCEKDRCVRTKRLVGATRAATYRAPPVQWFCAATVIERRRFESRRSAAQRSAAQRSERSAAQRSAALRYRVRGPGHVETNEFNAILFDPRRCAAPSRPTNVLSNAAAGRGHVSVARPASKCPHRAHFPRLCEHRTRRVIREDKGSSGVSEFGVKPE